MNAVLRVSITLVCLMEIVGVANNSTKKSTTIRNRRIAFRIPARESRRLTALRAAVAQLLATYVPRETFRTTQKYAYNQRHTRKEYNVTWIRSTRLTTKRTYPRNKNKTYATHLARRKMIYRHLVNVFSGYDEEKKKFLTKMDKSVNKNDTCYMQVTSSFMSHCFYDYYYEFTGIKYIRSLISRVCEAEWLTVRKINRVIEGCCGDKFKFEVFPNLF